MITTKNIESMTCADIAEDGLITMYPNPANTFIAFELPDCGKLYEINILDYTGRVIRNQLFNGGKQTMHIEDLANGAYLVEIITAEDRMAAPIVVLH